MKLAAGGEEMSEFDGVGGAKPNRLGEKLPWLRGHLVTAVARRWVHQSGELPVRMRRPKGELGRCGYSGREGGKQGGEGEKEGAGVLFIATRRGRSRWEVLMAGGAGGMARRDGRGDGHALARRLVGQGRCEQVGAGACARAQRADRGGMGAGVMTRRARHGRTLRVRSGKGAAWARGRERGRGKARGCAGLSPKEKGGEKWAKPTRILNSNKILKAFEIELRFEEILS